MRPRSFYVASVVTAAAAVAAFSMSLPTQAAPAKPQLTGIHKIKHVIVIMQENRSFDSYFGTFPGADGIPNGICVPDPVHHTCIKPYVDHDDSNTGGPHQN